MGGKDVVVVVVVVLASLEQSAVDKTDDLFIFDISSFSSVFSVVVVVMVAVLLREWDYSCIILFRHRCRWSEREKEGVARLGTNPRGTYTRLKIQVHSRPSISSQQNHSVFLSSFLLSPSVISTTSILIVDSQPQVATPPWNLPR
jgi:hypothetical protein